MDCINLHGRFGHRYLVAYEESYSAEYPNGSRVDDPWLQIVLCRNGHIYPYGGDMLAASTDRHGAVATALTELDCTTVIQDGDDGINAAFHVDDLAKVAAVMKPRRKRQLSEDQRQRVAEMGRANLKRYRETNIQSPENAPESSVGHQQDSEVALPDIGVPRIVGDIKPWIGVTVGIQCDVCP